MGCQYGGQELYFGHPTQISVYGARKIKEEQGDAYPEDEGESDSYFPEHRMLVL